ncbi:MAG: PhoPQ-activated protein PqaA family protein [Candidatus Thiodiazotropha sp.]|jgi:PhoPQ-activated pathogenicity-related protein
MKWIFLRLLMGSILLLFCGLLQAQVDGPLKTYVYANDPAYGYRLVGQERGDGFNLYFLNMDSQNWRTEKEVTPTLWNHWLTLIVPDQLTTSTANLIIYHGANSSSPPDREEMAVFFPIAIKTGSIQVVIQQVPAQSLKFTELDDVLNEDDLISYSWRKVMDSGDPTWSAYLPMTKAVVRGMDSAQDFIADLQGFELEHFIITGFSKRGAIAWLTAAIDSRVSAVVPGDYNILFLDKQIEHHYNSYGFFSSALTSYEKQRIFDEIHSPEGQLLMDLVDPINYKQALTMPHLILNATGDEFFLPDASEAYIHDIPGETLQRLIPNSNHTFVGKSKELIQGLIAWYQSQLGALPRPQINWQLDQNGDLEVSSDQTPIGVKLWQATNTKARDFRDSTLGKGWRASKLEVGQDGLYRAKIVPPVEGYTAYMVELTYPGVADMPQVYTTSVFITPDVEPFEQEHALANPRSSDYWAKQVGDVLLGQPQDYSYETLQAMLPIRVLGEYITSVEALAVNLDSSEAKQYCTAARLNVQAGEIGWYTTLGVSNEKNVKYWEPYQLAETFSLNGADILAAMICRILTEY